MTTGTVLEEGRRAFEREAWGDARAALSAADRETPLGPDDLKRLATAAYLAGRDAESTDAWTRAHQGFHERGEAEGAVHCAFWLGFSLMQRGETAQGGGWLARAQRLLDEAGHECAERGYLLLPVGLQHLDAGEPHDARDTFAAVAEIGARFSEVDLVTLGRLGQGQALLRLGEAATGVKLFDEAMVAVTAGELSPIVAGIVYCAVIDECQQIFDLARAREWTAALERWCESHPDLVPFRGQCLVHRAQLFQMHGDWQAALHEAQRALERLTEPPHPALGMACYQLGELHRLRGELSEAEEAYRRAGELGRGPHPGLALLRLAQGRVDTALIAIGTAVDEARDPVDRTWMLPAQAEITLAAGRVPEARAAVEELAGLAERADAPLLHATATHWEGAVLLADGDARGGLDRLRRAWQLWQQLETPYEAARTRVLIGEACRAVGDDDTAQIELGAAQGIFEALGAGPDLARVVERDGTTRIDAAGLTSRELEVLTLVASGKTNRGIAEALFISDKTVARHVSNIFTKLDVSSRAAATAYAYERGLV